MLAEFVRKIAARHSETACDFRLRAIGYFQRALNHRFFERGQEVPEIVRLGNRLGELIGGELDGTSGRNAVCAAGRRHWKILRSDLFVGRKNAPTLDKVAKFADISGEIVTEECVNRLDGDCARRRFQIARSLRQEKSAKLRDILPMIAQSGNRER